MRSFLFCPLSVLLLLLASSYGKGDDESIVDIPQLGKIQGLVNPLAREFRGIPYAAPPVRWQPPSYVSAWAPKVWDGTQDGAGCIQSCHEPPHACPVTTSEDCLFLNIFTPRQTVLNATGLLPVLIFIHGGNFKDGFGGGDLYNGTSLVQQNIILVAINYRLGVLGFGYTGDGPTDLPGNLGLADQTMAMEWVRSYILYFGGDANHVTIAGQSAGSMSCSSHLIMPSSRGLFQQVFLLSEPFALPFRNKESAVAMGNEFIYYTNCTGDNIGNCLNTLTVDQILYAQNTAQGNLSSDSTQLFQAFMPWCPTVETEILPNWPLYSFQNLPNAVPVPDIPILMGTTSSEGTLFIYGGFGKTNMSAIEYTLVMDIFFPFGDGGKVLAQYPIPSPTPDDLRPLASNVTTDGVFRCANRNASMALSAVPNHQSSIYLYEYSHLLSFGPALWNTTSPECWTQVCHGEDLVMWFYPIDPQFGVLYTPEETILSQAMRDYLGEFVRTGNPGNGKNPKNPVWTSVKNGLPPPRMQFDIPGPILNNDPNGDMCTLFDSIGYVWY